MQIWHWLKTLFHPYETQPHTQAATLALQGLEKLAPRATPVLLDALREGEALFNRYGLRDEKLAQFLAQICIESAYFTRLEENLNYSALRLLQVFPKRFTLEEANSCARNPQRIANRVYAMRIGNGDETSGEGWKYRGRGFIQLTGKANYARIGQEMGVDLLNKPDLLLNPKHALHSACAYWAVHKINEAKNTREVTGRINPALLGLREREAAFEMFKKMVG
jgi:putative chitinase